MIGILRIKDENGVWQDIQAIRGATGPAGKDGTDYILTEADKAEIAEMVEIPEVESIAVDGTTIIKNADGTISTAIGGYEIAGEEMFAWTGSLASGASAAIDISVFEDEFVDMDGDEITISFVLDGEEFEEEYEITAEKTEIVFENIKADLTTITVNLSEETITVEHEGELLSSLVIGSAAGYETINPNFIPVGRGLRRTSSAIIIDDSYIEDIIEDMGGTGGSVTIDGVTIVENEDGEICAAIGGGKTIAEKAVEVLSYNDDIGATTRSSGNSRIIINRNDYLSTFDSSLIYTLYVESRKASTGETFSASTSLVYESSERYNCNPKLSIAGFTVNSVRYYSSQGTYLDSVGATYEDDYVTKVAIIKPDVYEYSKINGNYIPFGAGLRVSAFGELETTVSGLTLDNTTNALLMTGNTISSGGKNHVALGKNNSITNSDNDDSVAMGYGNTITRNTGRNITIGSSNYIGGSYDAAAVGYSNTVSNAIKGVAMGVGCYTASQGQAVYGKWNIADDASAYTVIIGNGTDTNNRANGLTMDASGNVVIQGTVSANGGEKLMTESEVRALIQEIMNGGV